MWARSLDHHHSFFVRYDATPGGGGDTKLDMHHDASEVTTRSRDDVSRKDLHACTTKK